jgi:hypothetical protein
VNRSAAEVAEVPLSVVTVTSTARADPAGLVAVQVVAEVQETVVPTVDPKETVVEPGTNPVPVMATLVPPVRGPADGLTTLTVGVAL